MMILYNQDSKSALKQGIDAVADAVKITLGPSGKNVIIHTDPTTAPIITKDGVTVAKSIQVTDPNKRVGAEMIKEAAIRTNDAVGDGTTTSTVLAQAALNEGFNMIATGVPAHEVAGMLKAELPSIINSIKSKAIPIKDKKDVHNVAMISTNGDERLATLISNAYEKVGTNIVFEISKNKDTVLEVQEGMRFNSTYHSTYFINDKENQSIYLENGNLLMWDGKITSTGQITKLLKTASTEDRPLVIIAEDVDNNTIIKLLQIREKGGLNAVVISSPGFGFGRAKTLEDISIYTGAKIYQKDTTTPVFGKFDKIYINENSATITGVYGDKEDIKRHVDHLNIIKNDKAGEELRQVETRIARFEKGIGIIKIGASTQLELIERRDRLEDAINAVKAAVEEGIVAGGGMTLYIEGMHRDKLYRSILSTPHCQILENKGVTVHNSLGYDIDNPTNEVTVLDKLKTGEHVLLDYEEMKSEVMHFHQYIEQGIIDPVKVTCTALENAISVASTILTTECMVTWENQAV